MNLAFFSLRTNFSTGAVETFPGTLFNPPAELRDQYRLEKYAALKRDGWHISEFGYHCYVKSSMSGMLYVIPALHLTDAPPPRKRFKGIQSLFTKSDIEAYLGNYLMWEAGIFKRSEDELTALVHDLRHLSSSIYHSAMDAERALKAQSHSLALEGIETVIASQTMLKVRIDYLDYSNAVERFDEVADIPVYSRVDKVVRCFKSAAKHKEIDIELTGQSYRLASGPNILDIVPYVFIDNAIKYAPRRTSINVDVRDDDDFTILRVFSIGPKLHEAEFHKVFDKGFRGANARLAHSTGTGLGLTVANNVAKEFKGTLSVAQHGEPFSKSGIDFSRVCFTFVVPTAGEDSGRRRKFRVLDARRRKTRLQG